MHLPPQDDTLCDVCGLRVATGGNIRRVDGVDVTTHYCSACKNQVPIGHAGWERIAATPKRSIAVLLGLGLVLAAVLLLTVLALIQSRVPCGG
jgi:hypothetical protein